VGRCAAARGFSPAAAAQGFILRVASGSCGAKAHCRRAPACACVCVGERESTIFAMSACSTSFSTCILWVCGLMRKLVCVRDKESDKECIICYIYLLWYLWHLSVCGVCGLVCVCVCVRERDSAISAMSTCSTGSRTSACAYMSVWVIVCVRMCAWERMDIHIYIYIHDIYVHDIFIQNINLHMCINVYMFFVYIYI